MRIVVDVSPLSHPRTGVGNYVRGTLGGLVAAADGRYEVVAYAPVSKRHSTSRCPGAGAGAAASTR